MSVSTPDRSRVIHLAEARARIPGPAGEHSVSLLQRGRSNVELSLPVAPNEQTPHAQDEVYVIVRGRGVLLHDGNSTAPLVARSRYEARAEMNAPTGLRSVGRLSPERRFMA